MNHWKSGQSLQDGKYVIDKILGYGGSGITYCAQKSDSGKLVAIKTLNALVQTQPDFVKQQERFIQEAFRLAKCNHTHVIRVDNVCQEGELWCMVMEYIAGGNLRQYVNYKGVLTENEALRYIQQIGSALNYVHQQGFLHRDVKPGNIMLRVNTLEAVLIDFGLAREFIQDKVETHTNSRTESFAPIEQYERRAKRGAYTDVYALAATLYYLLTLQVPFPASFRQQGVSLIPPKQHNPHLSDRVNYAILKGMELLPENRPQSIPAWFYLLKSNSPLTPLENLEFNPPITSLPKNLITEENLQANNSNFPPINNPVSPIPVNKEASKIQNAIPPIRAAIPNPSKKQTMQGLELISAANIDYTLLKELLKVSKLKEADQETARIMLKVADREKTGWLDKTHIEQFPWEDLQTINQLWVKFSNGRFGFSVHKNIYQKLAANKGYNAEVWRNFGDKVGWRKNGNWVSYKELDFTMWAPSGHLPMLGMHVWGFQGWIAVLVARLESCKL